MPAHPSAPSSPAPRMPGAFVALVATLLIQALSSAAIIAPAVVAPAAFGALGWSAGALGVYMALAYAAAMCGSVLGGTVIERMGPVRCSQAGLLCSAAGMGLLTTGEPWLAAAGALLAGLGYGPITPASSYLLVRSTRPEQLSFIFSVKQTGVPLGGVLAALALPQAEAAVGWRGALALAAVACVACAVLAQPVQRALDADRAPPEPWRWSRVLDPVRLVWGTPALRLLACCSLVFSCVQLAGTGYLVSYLNLSLGLTLIAAGVVLSVAQVAGVAGRVLWGVVADRWLAPRATLVALALLMALACASVALLRTQTPFWLLAAVAALYGASAIGWNGVYLAEVARRAPAGMAGQATGGCLLFTYFGVMAGQPAFGTLAAWAGEAGRDNYAAAYAALMVPVLACALWLWRRRAG